MVLHLCMKYQVSRLKAFWVIALQQSVAEYVSVTLTFDILTPKSIVVFPSLSYICVWSI